MRTTQARNKKQGFRKTPRRLEILRTMREAVVLLTPIDLNHRAKEVPPGTTEAAVYRMIAFLSAA